MELFAAFYTRNIWKCAQKRWTFWRTRKLLFKWNYFFSIYKNSTFHSCPNVDWFLKNSSILRGFKKIILKGRGFRGGSDEKMSKMWLGLEIVVADLPPLVLFNFFSQGTVKKYFFVRPRLKESDELQLFIRKNCSFTRWM